MDTKVFDRLGRSLAHASSRRQVLALVAGAAVGGVTTASVTDVAAQSRRRNPFKNISVTGTGERGAEFTGKLTITRFTRQGGNLFAVGTLRGRLTQNGRSLPVSPRRVKIAVEQINGVDLSSLGGATAGVSAQQLACEVLTLTLGPLDLNLLGLRVQLNEINLRITAIPGGGLLGDLLCAIAGLLSGGGPLGTLLTQITRLLNQILGALG
jgi:hypothetical protein